MGKKLKYRFQLMLVKYQLTKWRKKHTPLRGLHVVITTNEDTADYQKLLCREKDLKDAIANPDNAVTDENN